VNVKCKYLTPFPRILIRAPNWIGDAVMAGPFLAAVKAGWPRAEVTVMARPRILEVVGRIGAPDSLVAEVSRSPFRLSRMMAAGGYDMAFTLTSSLAVVAALAMARIPVRVGFRGGGRGAFLTRAVAPLPRSSHQIDNYLSLAGAGGVTQGASPRWSPTRKDREETAFFLRKSGSPARQSLVALAPGAAYGPAKRWPTARWAALVDLLTLRDCRGVVIVGGAGEREQAEAIAAQAAIKPVDATGRLSLGGTAALLARCTGFVSNDSGLMHVGAATGVPTVGVFGSTSGAWTGPRGLRCAVVARPVPCAPCYRRACLPGRGYACLKGISPEAVHAALARLSRGR